MNTIKVRNIEIGSGTPKIIVPIVGVTKQEIIDKAVAFHGHWCPGISLGIRVAAWAMQNFGTAADEEIVAVTETDMCAVDAVQALVGCTFGKGNLIFRDRGKVAFTLCLAPAAATVKAPASCSASATTKFPGVHRKSAGSWPHRISPNRKASGWKRRGKS